MHLLCCKGWSLRYSPGWAILFAGLWCCLWGRGQRGNNSVPRIGALLQPHFASLPSLPTSGLYPFGCWIPGGWVCVCSRIPCVSPANFPVRVGISTSFTAPTDFTPRNSEPLVSPSASPAHPLPHLGLHSLAVGPLCPAAHLHPFYQSGLMFL